MRIQPVTTTNYNTQFKQLKIHDAQSWDIEILDRVVKNTSIREYAAYLAKNGKDLVIACLLRPIPIITAIIDNKAETIAKSEHSYTKEDLLEKLDKFDYKEILKRQEALNAIQTKRNSILAELDKFNKTI